MPRISLTRTLRFRISRRPLVRRALRAIPQQSTWLTIRGRQVSSARLCLEAGHEVRSGRVREMSDAIGTLHFDFVVPFENNQLGFFTVYDGSVEKYIPGLRRKNLVHFRSGLSNISVTRRQPQWQRTRRRSFSGEGKTTIRPSGFTAPIRASRFKTFEPCWPIARQSRAPLDSSCVPWS